MSAPVERAAAPTDAAPNDLHAAIMNLPCKPGRAITTNAASRQAYQEGHRDARHAAAELALSQRAAAPVSGGEMPPEAGREAIRLLAIMCDKYENGVQCYEDPEEGAGFMGTAVQLDNADECACIELLKKYAPTEADRAAVSASQAAPKLDQQQDQASVMPPFAAPAGQHGTWIAVTERLPEVGVTVLVYALPTEHNHPGEVNIGFDCIDPNDDDHASWLNHNEHYEHYCCVAKPEGCTGPSAEAPYTHWMPLPSTPDQSAASGFREGRNANDEGRASQAAPVVGELPPLPPATVVSATGNLYGEAKVQDYARAAVAAAKVPEIYSSAIEHLPNGGGTLQTVVSDSPDFAASFQGAAAAAAKTPTGSVALPTSANDAQLMTLLGMQYLEEHAPDRLRAAKVPTGELPSLPTARRVVDVIDEFGTDATCHIDSDMLAYGELCRAAAPVEQGQGAGDVPEGFALMPKRLTAENGAKGALSGEFKESITVRCHECGGSGEYDGEESSCPECDGSGTMEQDVAVTWDTIKDIYARAVELLAAAPVPAVPAADQVRDDALEEAAKHCENTKVWRNSHPAGMVHFKTASACANAIRALKSATNGKASDGSSA